MQTLVACQAEQEVDTVGLAPRHQCLADKAGITAQQDAHPWPAPADLRNNPRDFLDRPGSAVKDRIRVWG
jgi:hypothetical protein